MTKEHAGCESTKKEVIMRTDVIKYVVLPDDSASVIFKGVTVYHEDSDKQ